MKSDVEVTRLQAEAEGIKYTGDPDCSIPEQLNPSILIAKH